MTPAEIARAIGDRIRKEGFTPDFNEEFGRCCFVAARIRENLYGDSADVALNAIKDIVIGLNSSFDAHLNVLGWTKGCTDDAAAACDIAADLLTPEIAA